VAQHLATLGAALEAPLARLMQTASEVPQAAAGVLAQLRQEMAQLSSQENTTLAERTALVQRLAALMQTVEEAARQATQMAVQAQANAVELSSWGEAFGQGVEMFHAGNEKLATALQQVEAAISRSTARSDEQPGLLRGAGARGDRPEHQRAARRDREAAHTGQRARRAGAGRLMSMLEDAVEDDTGDTTAPVWTVFGDLMTGLLGAFVLVLMGVLVVQMDLVTNLNAEIEKRRVEERRRMALEKALAVPLASGRVTLANGRIGISGSVLFAFSSAELRPEGQQLLRSLVHPLRVYTAERGEVLMVSGFTDDRGVSGRNTKFEDNLELSAQRALTVTRVLIAEGMPPGQVFAAAFGAQQPVASNADEAGRAQNRRVEMAPVPRAAGPVAAAR
jgi:flagellar motor protein MotB